MRQQQEVLLHKPSPQVGSLIDTIESFQAKRGKLKFTPKQPDDKVLGEAPGSYLNAYAFSKAWMAELAQLSKGLATPHSRADARKLIKKYNHLVTELSFAAAYAKLALQQEFPEAQGIIPTVREGGIAVLTKAQRQQLEEGPKAVVALTVGLDAVFDGVDGAAAVVKDAVDQVTKFINGLREPRAKQGEPEKAG